MRPEKKLLLNEIKQKIDSSNAIYITSYTKLSPNIAWDFRNQLGKSGTIFEVVRKRVFLKAAEMSGLQVDSSLLVGHIGVAFVQQSDAISPTKLIYRFSEENQNVLQVICGRIEGKNYSGADVEFLSKLPSMNEMRAELIALLTSPMSELIGILEAVMSEPLSIMEQKS